MCPGDTAATDAQWGDRAFERQYRDRMGLRWLVCVCVSRARSTGACMAANQREVHHARRTRMGCGDGLGITRARRDALRWTRQENWTAQVRPWRYWARRDGQLAFESEWRRARRDPCGHRDTAWANRRG